MSELETHFDPAVDLPSDVLVRAIAVAENVDPTSLTPLAYSVDPDALDAVVCRDRGTTVRFPYEGYRVVVSASGTIELFATD
ncbi:HalOD1 output domain-containing protein [Halomarina salina]|uniref:HalOD1 output domain-containing protein n=1 Tax=Halomarina salina TaxID=1872699 RepID=A0ABD5RRS7_9EURY